LKKFIIVLFVLIFYGITATAQDENLPAPPMQKEKVADELNAEQIIEQNKAALVSIWYNSNDYYSSYYPNTTPKDTTLLSGSGFIFMKNGMVGTNYHVIAGLDSLMIKTSNGTFYNTELIYVEEKNDFAILKIVDSTKKEFPTVKLGNSDDLKVGQNIFAIGSPLGFEYTISEGIIAAIRENEKVSFNDPETYALVEKTFDKVIQITAAISPGNSGGALFNGRGEVVGITTYSYGFYGNLNFAVAINDFSKILNNINFSNLEKDENYNGKKLENLFTTNYKLAETFKTKVFANWFYSKQIDTMKKLDTFAVKQDSINRINLSKSELYFNACLDLRPDTFYVYQDLMELYVYTDNFLKAEDLYKKIKEKFDSDSLLNTLSSSLAEAYSTSKDYKKALTFYKKMKNLDSDDVFINYQIAYLNDMMKNYKKAIKGYFEVIRLDSNYIKAYIQLGQIYYDKKDYEKAKKYLLSAYERSELYSDYATYVDLYYLLGMIAVNEGRKYDALMAYIDIKRAYSYTTEEKKKKIELYKAILEMDK
jgi:S1-C subfamily serine protease/thioredoxin-like negative regulator of GroEL